ncbi:flavodoxin domain-containing protein [Nocardioides mesophilus]|uniref:Flavodoxin domain-containing protein n=1 Tax=Nocardioides mesophilus TaxID=433659 RepID=A0A7G9R7P3_9ACTN|nr:flavodoxin domain-containing protein [Nocardioides mesophilus]QNN51618.1 flavodoxin domain-containing protein [Nocardioides mesophilus]
MRVLVAYASEYGSTRGIAERIAEVLSEHGQLVDVWSVEEVYDLSEWQCVVVGSAVHNTAWLDQAQRFVARHQSELRRRQVWAFSVGMPAALRWPLRDLASAKEQAKIGEELRRRVLVRDHRLFSGVFDRDREQSRLGRLLFAVVSGRYGDLRDWEAIDGWAQEIAQELSHQPVG